MAKPKQGELNGMEQPKVKAVEDAAEAYEEVRDKRMALTEKEVEARTKLLAVMNKHGLKVYRFDDRVVEVLPTEKVKVRKAKDETDETDVDDD